MPDEYACDDCGAVTSVEGGYFRDDMAMFWCRACVPEEEQEALRRLDALPPGWRARPEESF